MIFVPFAFSECNEIVQQPPATCTHTYTPILYMSHTLLYMLLPPNSHTLHINTPHMLSHLLVCSFSNEAVSYRRAAIAEETNQNFSTQRNQYPKAVGSSVVFWIEHALWDTSSSSPFPIWLLFHADSEKVLQDSGIKLVIQLYFNSCEFSSFFFLLQWGC